LAVPEQNSYWRGSGFRLQLWFDHLCQLYWCVSCKSCDEFLRWTKQFRCN